MIYIIYRRDASSSAPSGPAIKRSGRRWRSWCAIEAAPAWDERLRLVYSERLGIQEDYSEVHQRVVRRADPRPSQTLSVRWTKPLSHPSPGVLVTQGAARGGS